MKTFLKHILVTILKFQARLVLKKYKPKIAAITGSLGKTSTRDAVYATLSSFFYVRKSNKEYDNEIGIPLVVLGCPHGGDSPLSWLKCFLKGIKLLLYKHQYPEWLILEVIARKPGDLKKVVSWIKTDVVVVTRFGSTPSHVEFFRSIDHLIDERASLIRTLRQDGTLLLNADDPKTLALKDNVKTKFFTFGFNTEATLSISNSQILYTGNMPQGITFRIDYEGNSVPVTVKGAFGKNHMYAAATAYLVARIANVNMLTAAEALKSYNTPPGRLKLVKGVKDSYIIDDTYNSSPQACESALQVLHEIKVPGKKIIMLGDMLELGKHTDKAHKIIGGHAAKTGRILITVGQRAERYIVEGALAAGMHESVIHQFEDAKKAGKFAESLLQKDDVILIKGSQPMRMERAVEEVMRNPENKLSELVRQDKEWLEIE